MRANLDEPSVKNVEAVARALRTDLQSGLTAQEVARRLAQDGPNELVATPRAPAWRRLLSVVPLEFEQWLVCAAMASVVLWFCELRKLASRASSHDAGSGPLLAPAER